MSNNLQSRIESKNAKIGVVGLGYVGLPLAAEFAKAGFSVTGIDIAQERVGQLNRGDNYISDVDSSELNSFVESGRFTATSDYSVVSDLDAVSICVPTPLSKLKDPDVSFIQSAIDELVKYIHPGLLIILESTTYPGTTRELILPALVQSGGKIGENLFLCFPLSGSTPVMKNIKLRTRRK